MDILTREKMIDLDLANGAIAATVQDKDDINGNTAFGMIFNCAGEAKEVLEALAPRAITDIFVIKLDRIKLDQVRAMAASEPAFYKKNCLESDQQILKQNAEAACIPPACNLQPEE